MKRCLSLSLFVILAVLILAACDTPTDSTPANPFIGTWIEEGGNYKYIFTDNTYTLYILDYSEDHGYYSIGSKLFLHSQDGTPYGSAWSHDYYFYDNKLYFVFGNNTWQVFTKQS